MRDGRELWILDFDRSPLATDSGPFGSKAIVLLTSGSVLTLPIDRAGQVLLDGRNLLDPNHPCWGGEPPVIAMPE